MSGLAKLFGRRKSKSKRKDSVLSASTGSLPGARTASIGGSDWSISAFESAGYAVKEKDLPKLLKAAWKGNVAKVRQLSEGKKADVNQTDKDHRTALHLAAVQGHLEVVQVLLSCGALINTCDNEGRTPLIKAVERNQNHCVDLLLNNGAEANSMDLNYCSALHVAAAHGNVTVGELLLGREAKVDVQDKERTTPLHIACGLGFSSFVQLLMDENANVNCADINGRTPLMLASAQGHIDIVDVLSKNNADIFVKDKEGLTALEFATEHGHTHIANLLEEHQRKVTLAVSAYGTPVKHQNNNVFSPQGSSRSSVPNSSVFGGPAVNIGGVSDDDISEKSKSEIAGAHSWIDTDSESETKEAGKVHNFSSLLNKTPMESSTYRTSRIPLPAATKESAASGSKADDAFRSNPPQSKMNLDGEVEASLDEPFVPSRIPKKLGSTVTTVEKKDSDPVAARQSELTGTASKKPPSLNLHLRKLSLSKSEDDGESLGSEDISEGELADDLVGRLAKAASPGQLLSKGVSNAPYAQASLAADFSIPPPPPPEEGSSDASDFDSSRPEQSFSDLPLAEVSAKRSSVSVKESAEPGPLNKTAGDSDHSRAAEWDAVAAGSDALKTREKEPVERSGHRMSPTPDGSVGSNDDWDSSSALPSEASEEKLRTISVVVDDGQVEGSVFEESSLDDEESQTSLDLPKEPAIPSKMALSTADAGKMSLQRPKFSTGISDEDSVTDQDTDIESQFVLKLPAKTLVPKPTAPPRPVKTTATQQRLSDLGFDLGDLSEVSDPEGLSSLEKPPIPSNSSLKLPFDEDFASHSSLNLQHSYAKAQGSLGVNQRDSDNEYDNDADNGMSLTESESEWERSARLRKEAKLHPLQPKIRSLEEDSDDCDVDDTAPDYVVASEPEHQTDMAKEADRFQEWERQRAVEEELLRQEVYGELNREAAMLDLVDEDFVMSEASVDKLSVNSEPVSDSLIPSVSNGQVLDGIDDVLDGKSAAQNQDSALKNLPQIDDRAAERLKRQSVNENIRSALRGILARAKSQDEESLPAHGLVTDDVRGADKATTDRATQNAYSQVLGTSSNHLAPVQQKLSTDADAAKNREYTVGEGEKMREALVEESLHIRVDLNANDALRKHALEREFEDRRLEMEKELQMRLKNAEEEEMQRRAALEEEERRRRKLLEVKEQETLRLLDEEQAKRLRDLSDEEVTRKRALLEEEQTRRSALEEEARNHRLRLAEDERKLKAASEARELVSMQALEEEARLHRLKLSQEEAKLRADFEARELDRMAAMEEEARLHKLKLSEEEAKLRANFEARERDRMAAMEEEARLHRLKLAEEEAKRRADFEAKELDLMRALEEEARLHKLKLAEEEKKLEAALDAKERDRMQELEEAARLHELKLSEEEAKLKADFEARERDRMAAMEKEARLHRLKLAEEEVKLKAAFDAKERDRMEALEEENRRTLKALKDKEIELEKQLNEATFARQRLRDQELALTTAYPNAEGSTFSESSPGMTRSVELEDIERLKQVEDEIEKQRQSLKDEEVKTKASLLEEQATWSRRKAHEEAVLQRKLMEIEEKESGARRALEAKLQEKVAELHARLEDQELKLRLKWEADERRRQEEVSLLAEKQRREMDMKLKEFQQVKESELREKELEVERLRAAKKMQDEATDNYDSEMSRLEELQKSLLEKERALDQKLAAAILEARSKEEVDRDRTKAIEEELRERLTYQEQAFQRQREDFELKLQALEKKQRDEMNALDVEKEQQSKINAQYKVLHPVPVEEILIATELIVNAEAGVPLEEFIEPSDSIEKQPSAPDHERKRVDTSTFRDIRSQNGDDIVQRLNLSSKHPDDAARYNNTGDAVQLKDQESIHSTVQLLLNRYPDETSLGMAKNGRAGDPADRRFLYKGNQPIDEYLIVDLDQSGENANLMEMRPEKDGDRLRFRTTSTPMKVGGRSLNVTEDFIESRRIVESLRERCARLEQVKSELETENNELHRTMSALTRAQNERESGSLEMDLQLRSLKYKLDKEVEDKTAAESLCAQLREQMAKLDQKLNREVESRQSLDVVNRKLQADLRSREQRVLQLETDLSDLKVNLESEQESRALQEDLYKEQLRQLEVILHEAQRKSHEHAQTVSKLEALDVTHKHSEAAVDNLRLELARTKGELNMVSSQLSESKAALESEVSKLRERLHSKEDCLSSSEKSLMQAQLDVEKARSAAETDRMRLVSQLEEEKGSRLRAEQEAVSLKVRFEQANRDFEKAATERLALEQKRQADREQFLIDRHQLDKELTSKTEQLQQANRLLKDAEEKIDSLRVQLKNVTSAMEEVTGKMELVWREKEILSSSVSQIEQKLLAEKETVNRQSSQLEVANQRIAWLQEQYDSQKQELELARRETILREQSVSETQSKLNDLLTSTKDDLQKERSDFQSKVEQLSQTVAKLTSELSSSQYLLKEQQVLASKLREENRSLEGQLSTLEIEKSGYFKTREELKEERKELKDRVFSLENQVKELHLSKTDTERKADGLEARLEHVVNLSQDTAYQLEKVSADAQALRITKESLERAISDLKRKNEVADVAAYEQKQKYERLLAELKDANEARQNLEYILSNVKGTNAELEERLHSEALHRSQREREADEHKTLWESEVKSRSKLGVKTINLEKSVNDLSKELDEEKRKTQRVLDLKKSADAKLEMSEQRSAQHLKEVSVLRSKLKQYHRKLKEYELGKSGVLALRKEFDVEREAMLENVNNLRKQLNGLSEQLQHEQEMRSKAEATCREQQRELNDHRTKDKVNDYESVKWKDKCKALESELDKQKLYYERNFFGREELEDHKRDLETKARLDLNKKLQEVNMHLEEQALARQAFEKIRSEKELKTRRELEETISELKQELSSMRTSFHEGLARRDTSEVEAKRFKELYENERLAKDKLSEQVIKANERLVESTARLSYERLRSHLAFDDSPGKSNLSKKLDGSPSPDKDTNLNFLRNPGLRDDMNDLLSPYRHKMHSTPISTSLYTTPAYDFRRNAFH